jgi:hypothetical protein
LAAESPLSEDETEGCTLIQTLVPQRSFLCADASKNIVVLKRVDEDCLHRQLLHPSIRDRLARVRELPHPRLATLRAVERWNGLPCLVWTYLDGETWDDAITRSPDRLPQLAAALVTAVAAMHEAGLVHGSIHGRNIIVRPDQQVWLTHVSPYLYTDPGGDIASVLQLLEASARRLPTEAALRLKQLIERAGTGEMELRDMAHALNTEEQTGGSSEDPIEPIRQPEYRISSLLAAGAVAITAAAIWFSVRWYASTHVSARPATLPSLGADARTWLYKPGL